MSPTRILVIEDEKKTAAFLAKGLREAGFTVDVAMDGETGLKQSARKKYDVMLCDWKMPGLNGRQVYEKLRATNPGLSDRMIFITGDLISEKTRKFLEQQNKICLPKPFTLVEFRAAINKVLAESQTETGNGGGSETRKKGDKQKPDKEKADKEKADKA